jgi:2-dehydropantoate 2-reductase
MRYIIYGAGGIGSSIGGHLLRTGHQSILIGRPGHVNAINQSGLTLNTPQDSYNLKIPAVTSPDEVEWSPDDIVMLCVKSQDTEEALRALIAAGPDPTRIPVFCAQNSITNEPEAARYFDQVYGVMVGFTGIYLEDGIVYNPVEGNAGYVEVGLYPSGIDELAKQVVSDLRAASFAVNESSSVMSSKGAKMIGNLGNALSAICDGKGDVNRFMERAREEARQCFTTAGIPFEERSELSARTKAVRGVNRLPENVRNLGSSWQSLVRKQGSIETDFLNGEIVRLGKSVGIETPFNRTLQLLASEMARDGEEPGKYTADEVYAIATSTGP